MSREDHEELLHLLCGFRRAKVLLSGYRCQLYDSVLRGWKRYEVKSQMNAARVKAGGQKVSRVEVVWCNF